MKLLLIFVVLNIMNVIIQTVKSLATIKCGKGMASIVNAIAYGLYTVVLVYTMCDLPLFAKALVVALCNLVGVYLVKYFEEKAKKDKLWKIECTVRPSQFEKMENTLTDLDIPYNYINVDRYIIFNIYSATQKQSELVKSIATECKAKWFVSESKNL